MAKCGHDEVRGKKNSKDEVASEEHLGYSSKLNLMRGFTGIVDRKGKLQFASEAPVKGLGYSEDDVLRKPFWEASWFAQSSKSKKAVKDSILGALEGETVRCEVEAFTKDGTAVPVTFSISPLKGKEGDIISIVAEAEAIVEAEGKEELRASDERLKSVFDLIEEAYFEADSKDRLTIVSPSGARLLGYESPHDLVGKRMAQFWASSEERDRFLMKLSREGNTGQYQASLLKKDGTEVVVELDAHLLYDANGDMRGSEGIFRDITGRTKAERELRESENAYRSTAELIRDVYFRASKEDTLVGVNTTGARLMGYELPEEVIGKDVAEFWVYPEERSQFMEQLSEEGIVEGFSVTLRANNGEHLVGEVDACLLRDDKGEIIGSHGVYRDATARAERERGLSEAYADLEMSKAETERKSEEKANQLSEMEAKYFTLTEQVTDGILLVQDGEIKFANGVMEKLLGYEEGEANGMQLATIVPPDWAESMAGRYEQWISGEPGEGMEKAQLLNKGGEVVEVEMSAVKVQHCGEPAVLLIVRDNCSGEDVEVFRQKLEMYALIAEHANEGVILADKEMNLIFSNQAMYDISGFTREEFQSEAKQAEKDLRLSELRYRSLFENMEDMYFAMDLRDMSILRMNPAGVRLLGYDSEEELIGKPLLDQFENPEDIMSVVMEGMTLGQQKDTKTLEGTGVVKRTGKAITIDITPHFMFDEDGQLVGASGILRDITERKKREEELARAELVLGTMSDGVAICDMQGIILDGNGALLRQMGYERDEVIGKSAAELLIPEGEHGQFHENLGRLLCGEYLETIEYTVIRKDRTELLTSVNLSVLEDDIGNPYGIVAVVRDITRAKQVEKDLRLSELRYRSLFENMEDMYFAMDLRDMNILRMNPAGVRALGCDSEEELIGKSLLDQFENPEDIMSVVMEGMTLGQQKDTKTLEGTGVVKKTGKAITIDITPHFTFDEDGQLVGAGGILKDITERKLAEEKLRESERTLKRLVEQLRVSQEELSTPVVQIWDSILALPLIGVLDSRRGQRIMEVLLSRIVQTQSEIVILDVTGVSSMDTDVTNTLVKTIQSTNYLGAKCVITGVRSDIAQTMSNLGVDMSKFIIKSDMQDGLRWGLDKIGYQLSSGW